MFENHRNSLIYNIASEASYVCILSGKKLIKNVQNGPFCRFLKTLKIQTFQLKKKRSSLRSQCCKMRLFQVIFKHTIRKVKFLPKIQC